MGKLALALERLSHWDEAWCLRINRASRLKWVRGLFWTVSRLGDGVFWYVLMLALLALGGKSALPAVLHMLLTGTAGIAVYKFLKVRTSRPRPYQLNPCIFCAAAPLDQFSFPSGHTLHAVALTLVALSYFPWLAGLLIPFTLLVAASRPILGLHYPSDVLAGAALGAGLAALVLSF